MFTSNLWLFQEIAHFICGLFNTTTFAYLFIAKMPDESKLRVYHQHFQKLVDLWHTGGHSISLI